MRSVTDNRTGVDQFRGVAVEAEPPVVAPMPAHIGWLLAAFSLPTSTRLPIFLLWDIALLSHRATAWHISSIASEGGHADQRSVRDN
jgi:hypothetical protein